MKKIIILSLIIFTVFACNSDDDNTNETQQNQDTIIGTWRLTSITEDGENISLEECDELSTLVISASQIKSFYYYGNNCEEEEFSTINYTINGNMINSVIDGVTYEIEIITLNNTTFTFKELDDGIIYTDTYTRQ